MRITKLLTIAVLLLPTASFAQSLIDATRLASNPLPVGGRNAGLDGALLGAIGGYDALEWNPAALAPIEHFDFGVTLFNGDYNSSATFLGNGGTSSQASPDLGSIGAAFPAKTVRGHLTWAISYDAVSDYTGSYSFNGFNPNSSFINTQGFLYGPDPIANSSYLANNRNALWSHNLAYYLGLTYEVPDSGLFKLTTPITDHLQESGSVTDAGSMHALRLGAGVDVAEGLSVGATVNLFLGDYSYSRMLYEKNVQNNFPTGDTVPLGFQEAQIVDTRDQSMEGISLKLGILSYSSDMFRLGLTIETPTVYSVDDHFHESGSATYSSGTITSADNPQVEPDVRISYNVTTPIKVGIGGSFNLDGLMIAASATYADMSELRFSNSGVDLSDLNDSASQDLKGVFDWNVGAEYLIKPIGLTLRAGYAMAPSPYKGDPSNYNETSYTFGARLLLSKNFALEGAYRHVSYSTEHMLYSGVTPMNTFVSAMVAPDAVTGSQISLGIAYKF